MVQTLLDTYGVDNYTKTPEYKAKQKEGFMRHYGVDHNMKCEKGRAEWSEAYKASTGYDHNWKNPECRENMKKTLVGIYGVDHNMKCERGKEQWREGIRRKYGSEYDHDWKVPEVREHQYETCQKRYGVRNPMQCPEIQRKAKIRYKYDGISFDSKPEIALYLWLKDRGVQFEYQPDCDFRYEYEGKTHRYYPDFRIGGVYVEIKGDHMIAEDGSWICPWDRSQDGLYDAKRRCAEENGVVVLDSEGYAEYLAWSRRLLGPGFLEGLKEPAL